jgi:hypothetical protein
MPAILIKWGCMALALAALLVGAYSVGHADGTTKGYQSGWSAQQVTIDKMVSDENARRNSQNTAITNLETKAAKDSADLFAAKAAAVLARGTIVTQYKTKYVAISQSCGWSNPTVLTINSLIDVGATTPATTGAAQ